MKEGQEEEYEEETGETWGYEAEWEGEDWDGHAFRATIGGDRGASLCRVLFC